MVNQCYHAGLLSDPGVVPFVSTVFHYCLWFCQDIVCQEIEVVHLFCVLQLTMLQNIAQWPRLIESPWGQSSSILLSG